MTKAPVSMCLIVKNDPLLEECIKSFKDFVQEIVVVDTGSTDGTAEIARKYADIFEVYTACNDPETGLINDFSMARQRSFDLATQPWICWCDSDDIIENAQDLARICQEFETANKDLEGVAYLFPYEYSYDQNGKCICRHYRERLFYNKSLFNFVNPVHEVVVPKPGAKIALITREEILFKHRRQFSNKVMEQGRNLRILRKHFEKVGETDARQMYYLGLECCNSGLTDEAIKLLSRYIDISGWDDERVMASLKLCDIFQGLGKFSEGLTWAFKSVEINEQWGEGYFALARMFYHLANQGGPQEYRNWERCAHFAKVGLTCPPTKTLLFVNPNERDVEIHKYLNMALNKMGRVEEALESTNTGLSNQPDEPILLGNKKLYEAFLARNRIMENVGKLKTNGNIEDNDVGLISKIINNQPLNLMPINNATDISPINQLPSINQPVPITTDGKTSVTIYPANIIRSSQLPATNISADGLDIVFFIGDGVEVWTPDTLKITGMGGSETAAWQMSRLLAARGHKVRVFSGCGNGEGFYEGVEYLQSQKYQNLTCDVLIVSRRAEMLADTFNVQAKLKLLWVHDVYALNATNELLLKADRVLALSKWHKQNIMNIHNLHDQHIIQTRNGIDLSRFDKVVPRNRFKAVNSSSPDRSWPALFDVWPRIKAQVPQAELHLYYGFKNWEYSAQFQPGHIELINQLKAKIKELEPLGVVYHDRINQDKLAEEYLSAGCQIYPTWFSESSNIGGMEAQAAGLRIITSSIAALNETVANRGVLIDGDWLSSDYQNKFVAAVVAAMNKEDNSDRLILQQYAKDHFSWTSLAADWEKMFKDLIEELKINPVVPYQPTEQYKPTKKEESPMISITSNQPVKLNIGCGPNFFPYDNWTNYDHESDYFNSHIKLLTEQPLENIWTGYHPLANYLKTGKKIEVKHHDIRKPFPQHPDNSVDFIYLGQVIEHINYFHEAPKLIKECYRMLKPGGVLRITTPDIEILVNALVNNEMSKFNSEQPDYYQAEDSFSQLAMIMYGSAGEKSTHTNYQGHQFLYGKRSMHKILVMSGFYDIRFYYEAGKGDPADIVKEIHDEGMTHSFITQASK